MPGRGAQRRPGCSRELYFRRVLEGASARFCFPVSPGWAARSVAGRSSADTHHPGSPPGRTRVQATQLDLRWIRLRSRFNDCDKPGLKLRVAPETATRLLPPQTPRLEGNLPPGPARAAGPACSRHAGPRRVRSPCACEGTSGAASPHRHLPPVFHAWVACLARRRETIASACQAQALNAPGTRGPHTSGREAHKGGSGRSRTRCPFNVEV